MHMDSPTGLKLALFAAITTVFGVFPVSADIGQDVTMKEATTKINLAGRQRMLSQRMSKAACLVSQDIDYQPHYEQLTTAHALFVETDAALRTGNPQLGLKPEPSPKVLYALSHIDAPWADMDGVIDEIMAGGTVDQDLLFRLNNHGLEVLKFMNEAVGKTARVYGSVTPDVPLEMTIAVDLAGRQRMLTQKMTKETCLMALADDPADLQVKLAKTVRLFDVTLDALINGYPSVGLLPAPSEEIRVALEEVNTIWAEVKPHFDKVLEGDMPDKAALAQMSQMTEPLLRQMNKAVGLYSNVPTAAEETTGTNG